MSEDTEAIYGKTDAELLAEGKSRWEAQKAALDPSKQTWEHAAFKADPEVTAIFTAPTKDDKDGPEVTPEG